MLSADHDPAAVPTPLANFPGPCFELDLSDPERVDDLISLTHGLEIDLTRGAASQPFSRLDGQRFVILLSEAFVTRSTHDENCGEFFFEWSRK